MGCTPGQTLLSIKTAADEEKDPTVVQGLTTLSLMHRGTFTEYKTDKASNPIYAEYSMAMKITIEKPQPDCKTALGNLLENDL